MNEKTKKIVMAALMTALACIATMIIKIPSPLKGYLNVGDCIVLMAGWTLSPLYGFLAAGLGSALADVLSGYIVYAPATFIIKGCMALAAFYTLKIFAKCSKKTIPLTISGITAEFIMVLGYFVYEGFLYGFIPSLANIPANGMQGLAGVIIGISIMKILEKSGIKFK